MKKYSRQRELIEQAVKENLIHPTADDIYRILKPHNQNLSLGTVYRNLMLLAENGRILKLHIPGGSDRFDGNINAHQHFCCNACGRVYDVNLSFLNELDKRIENETGFQVTLHQLIISGTCKDCINQ